MQLRMNNVQLNECPKFLANNPTDQTHALTIPTKDEDYLTPSQYTASQPTSQLGSQQSKNLRKDTVLNSPMNPRTGIHRTLLLKIKRRP